jgi:uncharacterized protein YwgA
MTVEVLGTILKRMGSFDPAEYQTDFDARLRLQKAIYLFQHGYRVNLGYPFNYHLRGPYSSAVALDAYRLSPYDFDRLPTLRFKDPDTESKFEKFLALITPHRDDAKWLETSATLLWQWRHGKTDLGAVTEAMALKGQPVDDDYCQKVLDELKAGGLLSID